MRIFERVQHKLTAYHWRFDRRSKASHLGICSCGWKARSMRTKLRDRIKELLCRHEYGEIETVSTGPVGAPESEFVVIGQYRQCDKCYRTEDVF